MRALQEASKTRATLSVMDTARELTANLAALLRREHGAMADFLVALADFDRGRRWAELGYASLFQFLHRELRLSLGAAQYRKVAAELIEEVPAVAEALRLGQLCFTAVIEASKVVTAANWEAVLPRFHGLSRREATELVAELQPHPAPPARTVLTPVRAVASEAAPTSGPEGSSAAVLERATIDVALPVPPVSTDEMTNVTCPAVPVAQQGRVDPLTAELRRLHVTVSREFARKLKAAADARPDLTMEQILEAGLDLLLQKSAKAKGLVDRPLKAPRPSKDDTRIPAHLKREAMERAGGRCEFVFANDETCGSTHDLEFHHVTARAKGGKAVIVDDIKVACSKHNDLAARQDFGNHVMDRYTGPKRRRRRGRS
jgi:hypothetical protein